MSIMCSENLLHVMKNYFTTHNIHYIPGFFFFFLWLKNVVIPKYNKYSKLTLTKKIEEHLSTRVSACLEASIYKKASVNTVKRMKRFSLEKLKNIQKKTTQGAILF